MALFSKIQYIRARPLFILVSEFIDEEVCEEVYRWRKMLKVAAIDDNLDILIHSPGGDLTACYRTARLFSQ
jgi:ATP-dependent protease ClpP protease subunit